MSLTMTYFHGGSPTIIGAVLFHGPVRDGKGWFQDAMVVRLQLVCAPGFVGLERQRGRSIGWDWVIAWRVALVLQGYRIKPHGEDKHLVARDAKHVPLLSAYAWSGEAVERILRVPAGFMRNRTQERIEALAAER